MAQDEAKYCSKSSLVLSLVFNMCAKRGKDTHATGMQSPVSFQLTVSCRLSIHEHNLNSRGFENGLTVILSVVKLCVSHVPVGAATISPRILSRKNPFLKQNLSETPSNAVSISSVSH